VPKKTFVAGEVLTAAEVNTYLMDQAVMTFAGTAARGSAIASPSEGMVSYLDDSNQLEVYAGTAVGWTAVGADVPLSGNAVINGDFGVWQRGTSFSGVTTNTYTADRWLYQASGATSTITRESFTPAEIVANGFGDAKYYIRVEATVANDNAGLRQKIEDVRTFAGQTAVLSFWAKSDATSLKAAIGQSFGSGGSSFNTVSTEIFTPTTSWVRYSFEYSIDSLSGKTIGDGSALEVEISNPNSELFTMDVWGVQLEAGSVATPFRLAGGGSKGAELALCQRYYEKSYNVDVAPGTSTTAGVIQEIGGSDTSGNTASAVSFAVSKRAAPTITLYSATGVQGDWLYFRNGASGETTASAPFVGETRMRVDVASVGAAFAVVGVRGHFVADAEL
jgi:hypothetical protein